MKTEPTTTTYVVNLLYPLTDQLARQEAVNKLAPTLNLSEATALKLLSRQPGPIIKPTSLENAERIAHHFIAAGVPVEVILSTPKSVVFEQSLEPSVPVLQPISNDIIIASRLESHPETKPIPLAAVVDTPMPAFNLDGSTAQKTRRGSLRTNLILMTLIPLLGLGLAITAYLYATLPQSYFDLANNNIDRFVLSLSSTLNEYGDGGTLKTNLNNIVSQKEFSIGMIDVEPSATSGIDPIFASRYPETADALEKEFDAFRKTLPGQSINPSFEATSFGTNANEVLTIVWADVYQQPNGQRRVVFDSGEIYTPDSKEISQGNKIFRVNVGWLKQKSQNTALSHVLLILGIIGFGIALAVALATLFASRLAQPIVALTQAADRISLGELETPVTSDQNNELGDLAAAVERMRVSLKSALERLRKRR